MKTCSACGATMPDMPSVAVRIGDHEKSFNYCSVRCIKKSLHSSPVKKMLMESLKEERE